MKKEIKSHIKRLLLSVFLFLLSLQSFAQSQYDYYDDTCGGVDNAIKGLKIMFVVIIVIVVIVFVGGIIAKIIDFFKPPKSTISKNKPIQNTTYQKISPKPDESDNILVEPEHKVIITIIGDIIDVDVTMNDGSKQKECFWYDIGCIVYNLKEEITHNIGDAIVKPAGSIYGGCCVKREDIKLLTKSKYTFNNLLTIRGKFNPKKLQLVNISGTTLYDGFVYYYDEEAKMQCVISEESAKVVVDNASLN